VTGSRACHRRVHRLTLIQLRQIPVKGLAAKMAANRTQPLRCFPPAEFARRHDRHRARRCDRDRRCIRRALERTCRTPRSPRSSLRDPACDVRRRAQVDRSPERRAHSLRGRRQGTDASLSCTAIRHGRSSGAILFALCMARTGASRSTTRASACPRRQQGLGLRLAKRVVSLSSLTNTSNFPGKQPNWFIAKR
jgi:hypothetical protein